MEAAVPSEVTAVLERSRELGFLGPLPVARQIEHSLGFWRAIVASGLGSSRRILDLGSGGGLPGLVLVDRAEGASVALLDGSVRRCAFLEASIEELAAGPRVQVLCGRAEELGRREELRSSFDLVVARSFGPPAAVAECAAPFLSTGGHLLVSEPPEGSVAERWPEDGISLVGLGAARLVVEGSRFALLTQVEQCPDRYSRRTGIPTKRPLF
jgi:16S rRNA (guanine527-N7)-methyltransferase